MKKRNCTIRDANTKTLISCVVTAQLICSFVLAYANSRFSHDAAQDRDDALDKHVKVKKNPALRKGRVKSAVAVFVFTSHQTGMFI